MNHGALGIAGGGDDPRADRGSPAYRRALVALFCAGLATFAQMYSPQGLLPEIARAFGVDAGVSSWAVGATTIGVAFGVLPWAKLSDHWGRVRTMRWATGAAMALGLAVPFAPGFENMLVLRGIEGFALAGIPALAVTALAETVRPRALGGAVGIYVAGTTLGGLVGRLLAGAVEAEFGWRAGMVSVAVLATAATVAFALLIPPTAPVRSASSGLVAAIRSTLTQPGVVVLIAHAFLTMGGFVAAYNALPFRLELAPYSLTLVQVSWLFLAYLAGTVAAPLPVIVVGLVLFTGGFFGAHTIASGLIGRRAAGTVGASQAPPMYNLGYYAGSSLLGWVGTSAFTAAGWQGTAAMIGAVILLAAALAWAYARRHGGIARADALA